jgi:HTH-type transcriptional regulator, glycine betaine synthesis regulator
MSATLTSDPVLEVRGRLVDVGGQTSHELGLGRIFGQMLVYLYLREGICSLDEIGQDLGLSKAATSIAARQLESLGLLRRVWVKGDRKSYYRTADDIGSALQQGLLSSVRQKISTVANELDVASELLTKSDDSVEAEFLKSRVKRATHLGKRARKLLESPLLKLFVRS